MAGVIKVHPRNAAQEWEQVGKKLTWFTVTGTAIPDYDPLLPDPQVGWEADGAVNAMMAAIQKTTTVVAMGPVIGGAVSIAVEGEFTGADNFDGTIGDGDLARMQAEIQALGVVIGSNYDGTPNGAGVDLSLSVVTPKTFVLA